MLIKPAGSLCNRRCQYCFYTHPEQRHRMDDAVLETVVRRICEQPSAPRFIWQGGEPLLMGLDFFQRAFALQDHYAQGRPVHNAVQTNGTLLDDTWARLFRERQVLVGVSLDGPRELHERYRPGSFDAVLRGLQALSRQGVEFNLLAVVGLHNVEHPARVYRFLRDLGPWLQFIPLVGLPEAASAQSIGRFWTSVFDTWRREDLGRVSVRLFEDAVLAWAGAPGQSCIFSERCEAPVVEHDGGVYACDHAVDEGHRLGSLTTDSLDELMVGLQPFAEQGAPPADCATCPWLFACQGGCPLHREGEGVSVLCDAYRHFFRHADDALRYLAWLGRQGRGAEGLAQAPPLERWGRGLPCRCGSGRRLKSCCGLQPEASSSNRDSGTT